MKSQDITSAVGKIIKSDPAIYKNGGKLGWRMIEDEVYLVEEGRIFYFTNKEGSYYLKCLIDNNDQVSILEHSSNIYELNEVLGEANSGYTLVDLFPIGFELGNGILNASGIYGLEFADGVEISGLDLVKMVGEHRKHMGEYALYSIIDFAPNNSSNVVFIFNIADASGNIQSRQYDAINNMIYFLLPEFEDQLELNVRPNEHVINLLPNQNAADVIKTLRERFDDYGVVEWGAKPFIKKLNNRQVYELSDEGAVKNRADSSKPVYTSIKKSAFSITDKVTTADCKQLLETADETKDRGKNWKRVSKNKQEDGVARIFVNHDCSLFVRVVEREKLLIVASFSADWEDAKKPVQLSSNPASYNLIEYTQPLKNSSPTRKNPKP